MKRWTYALLPLTSLALTVTGGRSLAQSVYTPYTFITLAGNAGYGSADGTGNAARFNKPFGVVADSTGNVYVADAGNQTIRKVTPTQVVTTLAGAAGRSGSADGTGRDARFYYPSGVALDSVDNVYVADSANHTIRKVTPAGVVTTLAGLAGSPGSADGTGSEARFRYPFGVAVDSGGNVYVADSANHTIRKVTPMGVVTTLAGLAGSLGIADGTGSGAQFNGPSSVAVDVEGNVYVADSNNNTIRKVTAAGVVTTLAGLAGNFGSTDGTGSDARFSNPSSVAVDGTGNVFVADRNNFVIRRLTPAGAVTTLAGLAGGLGSADGTGSDARLNYAHGVTVDSAGNVYVADSENHTIRKIAPGNVVTTLAGLAGSIGSADGTGSDARFHSPFGVAVDSAGDAYVADSENHTIRKVTPAGVVTLLAGLAGSPGSTDGNGSDARFNKPTSVAVDSAGNVYVADAGNETIRKVTLAGVVTTLAGLAGTTGDTDGTMSDARFASPNGVSVDGAGNVYVADTFNNTIRKVTPGGVVTTLAGLPGGFGSADGAGTDARFTHPYGAAVDRTGNVYVADTFNQTIRKVTSAGVVTTLAGLPGSVGSTDGTGNAARFWYPYGVAVDRAGNVYVADANNSAIRKVTPAGVVTTLAGLPGSFGSEDGTGIAARFFSPAGVTVDNTGNVYVADTRNNTIRKGLATPVIVTASIGFTAGAVGFNLTGPSGHLVVLDASTDFAKWMPIMTNTFGADPLSFSDPQSGANPNRYYRARLP